MQLLILTNNLHKQREIKTFFKKYPIELLTLRDFPNFKPLEPTNHTQPHYAVEQTQHAASTLGVWAFSDVSCLFVPALDTYFYDGETREDEKEKRKKLLHAMGELKDIARCAVFSCYLCLASPKKIEKKVSGSCEGLILEQEQGQNGFGYDPLFCKHDYGKTFAEVSELVKNQISHRGKALELLWNYLEQLPAITSLLLEGDSRKH